MRKIVFGLLASAAIASPAQAQQAAQAEQAASAPTDSDAESQTSSDGIGDIVVTAQKKAERLQNVPITITAFDGNTLQRSGMRDIEGVAKMTPGLFVGKFDNLRPQVYLRGIGSRVFDPGSEGSIGIFIDESYMGRFSGSITDMLDVERVEVLKGPQGTLYGRNTIGGAVNIITKAPTREFEGYGEATVGNFGLYDLRAVASGPLSDGVRVRVAGRLSHRNGFSLNTLTGVRGNGDDGKAIRGRLDADLSSNLTAGLTLEYQESDAPGLLQKTTGTRQFLQAATSPSYTPTADLYSDAYNVDGYNRRKLFTALGKLQWDGEVVSLTSITSYRDSKVGQLYDLDSTPRDIWTYSYDEHSRQFSQEFRIASASDGPATLGGALNWVLGFYYYNERSVRDDHFDMGADSIYATSQSAVEHNTFATRINTDSFAAFGQATVNVTEKLHLTIGGRYTRDKKSAIITTTTDSVAPPSYYPGFTVNPSKVWESFDPKFIIDYRFTPHVMGYVTVSRGFKSGGFQFNATNATLAAVVFNPERAWTYEVGLKSQFFDNRVQLNVAAFQYDYKDLQLTRFTLLPPPATPGSGSNIVSNAAQSTIKGIDTSIAVAASDHLTLTGGVSYLDAKYDDYITGSSNFSGNRMIRSPEWQANAAADYNLPIGAGLKLHARGEWSYTSKVNFEADAGLRPFTSQNGYSLFNLRLGLAEIDDRWSIEGWVNNVGNKHYITTEFALPVAVLQTWAIPRTFGATARLNF